LIKQINDNPDLLEEDWRELVRGHFLLSAEEKKRLVDLPPRKVKKIQQFLREAARHIQQGGKVTGKLVKRPVNEQTPELVYDVAVDLVPTQNVRRRKG